MPKAIDDLTLSGKQPDGHPIIKMDLSNPPTVNIAHAEFPRMVYRWPKKPFSVARRRNELQEIEKFCVANEAESKIVQNKEELEAALKAGWKKEHYVAPAPPEFFEEEVEEKAAK